MTQALFMAYKSEPVPGEQLVNGVRYCLVNLVSTSNAAAVKAACVAACNAAYQGTGEALNTSTEDAFGPDYFDSTVQIGDLSGGPLNANNDAYVLDPVAGPIAATA